MQNSINILFLLVFPFVFWAQGLEGSCGTILHEENIETRPASWSAKQMDTFSTYVIPVIFHIVHGGEAVPEYPNIATEQIQVQMTVINQDFSGNAYNTSNYPVDAFINWASAQNLPLENLDALGRVKIADMGIQFCLATHDPAGNELTEPGINRINYITKGWQNPNTFTTQTTFKNYLDGTIKPQSIWDVTKYLNIWISDKNALLTYGGVSSVPPFSTLLGLPNTATDTTDGIWCYTKSIGSYALYPSGTYFSSNIDGRTLTHEAGHYVGLRHIWGDANCGNDFCNDTPPAADENNGAPIYPHHVGTCSTPNNNPDGEMFMNFMDYTIGSSKYMFTHDQVERAQIAMLNSPFRNELGTHQLCEILGNKEYNYNTGVTIFPNPAADNFTIVTKKQFLKIELKSLDGHTVLITNNLSSDVSFLSPGLYFVYLLDESNRYVMQKLLIE